MVYIHQQTALIPITRTYTMSGNPPAVECKSYSRYYPFIVRSSRDDDEYVQITQTISVEDIESSGTCTNNVSRPIRITRGVKRKIEDDHCLLNSSCSRRIHIHFDQLKRLQ